jgi:hypothetical protein
LRCPPSLAIGQRADGSQCEVGPRLQLQLHSP